MSFVNGLGGCFIFSEDPGRYAEWLKDTFKLELETYGESAFGLTFTTVDPEKTSVKRQTVFSVMRAKAPIPNMPGNADPSDMYGDQPFMVNLRVDDLEALVGHLETRNIDVLGREEYPYGRFAWIRDPDGRRMELWEPLESF